MYDLATLTPVERPAGTPLVMSDEQAAKLEKDVAARKSYQDAPIKADRGAPPVGGDGSAGAAGNVGGYNSFWIDSGSRYLGDRGSAARLDPHRPAGRPHAADDAGGARSASPATCGRPRISRRAKTIPASKAPAPTTTPSGGRSASAA